MTGEFDKILKDSRGIKRTMNKLEQSEVGFLIFNRELIDKLTGN
jgi:hypothetical protein